MRQNYEAYVKPYNQASLKPAIYYKGTYNVQIL